MAGIVAVFLAVPLQVLIAFEIIKAELLVVVDLVVVMHGFCARSQQRQNVVIINTFHVFMHVSCVVGN